MSDWRILHKEKDLTVGMWLESGIVYFTIENLTPSDVMGRDIDIPISIEDLEKILIEAKTYEKQIAGD